MESGIEFMSWTKCLAAIVRDATYSEPIENNTLESVWKRHHDLAKRLVAPRISPGRRLSVLVELGGIELILLGRFWWVAPSGTKGA
jgi:hypothetical protein